MKYWLFLGLGIGLIWLLAKRQRSINAFNEPDLCQRIRDAYARVIPT